LIDCQYSRSQRCHSSRTPPCVRSWRVLPHSLHTVASSLLGMPHSLHKIILTGPSSRQVLFLVTTSRYGRATRLRSRRDKRSAEFVSIA
jgi:hypothetical protein